jgi:competence protein ComEC
MKKTWQPLVLLLLLTGLIIALIYLTILQIHEGEQDSLLSVVYIDVGQGDATFIESPAGTQVLIDGGRGVQVLKELPRLMGYFDRTLDVVVATHPDADHIGGLIDVLERYTVETIVMTDNVNDTPAYEAFMREVQEEGATIFLARRRDTIHLGMGDAGSTTLEVLFPDRSVVDVESNTSSMILKLSYGSADFLFTGDSPSSIETYLIGLDGSNLESEILKIGHHGSRTSTDPAFVEAVRPQYGIISAGKDNDYGHPHKEVMETLSTHEVITKNTADEGSIFLESDGNQIWLR